MRFEDKVEQRRYINVCVELGTSSMEIKQPLENTQTGVFIALVYL